MRATESSERVGRALARDLGARPGLCGSCRHAMLVRSSRSVFLRCRLADSDPAFRRYPALPVDRCPGFEPRQGEDA